MHRLPLRASLLPFSPSSFTHSLYLPPFISRRISSAAWVPNECDPVNPRALLPPSPSLSACTYAGRTHRPLRLLLLLSMHETRWLLSLSLQPLLHLSLPRTQAQQREGHTGTREQTLYIRTQAVTAVAVPWKHASRRSTSHAGRRTLTHSLDTFLRPQTQTQAFALSMLSTPA